MSFSSNCKAELCRIPIMRRSAAVAESYGVLLYCNTFSPHLIRIVTESEDFTARLPRLFKKAFGVEFDTLPDGASGGKQIFLIESQEKIAHIFSAFGVSAKSSVALHVNFGVLEEDADRFAFLRGAFLMAGTVAGPDKKSHLELTTSHASLAGEQMSLLLDLHLFPKQTERRSVHVLYFKDGASVEDFLTTIGAPQSAMELMEAKVEKNLRNTINRQVNCETANLMKTTGASARQVAAITAALNSHGDTFFPENLRETVRLRLQYPADSLSELAARFDPPISKPGLSHRLKKITERALECTLREEA